MPSPSAAEFEAHRVYLTSVAYRMLGNRAEAEDAVQEAWLRYAQQTEDIRDARGWLTTVTARICLDQLNSARVRRAAYPGQWLPAYVVDPDAGPAELAERADQVSVALLVVMERLTPEQRVALVLHDAFAVPFEEVATVLDTTPAAARQHASRARRAIADGGIRHTAGPAEQRRVLTAFLVAAQSGDVHALAAVLAPDVVAISDGGGVVRTAINAIGGAEKVARFYAGLLSHKLAGVTDMKVDPVLVNGDAAMLLRGTRTDGRPLLAVLTVAVDEGRITGLFNQQNPEKVLLSDL
ncbi:putative RNA polymerase ECF-subfamily sigma factor [Actinoplanes missouriensis 431]|uniref:Putative RNA polymerase ECF-subfamily sigma factor n=1 Tax=Actinoplanes missouriensis (strain ATCC 14538 / DSM 43046 / CBS 188.64 / JCM 3121 / NBRC 102363 / NCIMB 12654 / NRRL B-3342 / UNCC 431) TaxID=512565 RepID=I0HIR4_ACTM4|nr:RNA polymerase sigma factor SigJ [Actinoplanes missouriensis]BAL92901.1 putative RNA polymerase ECF-subfamily sigma factor [Actinoplanes missouriensis 431]